MSEKPPPAGWYPDGTGTTRWWDGEQWTEHSQPQPALDAQPATSPEPVIPPVVETETQTQTPLGHERNATSEESIKEQPLRVCPKCSVQAQVEGDFCPRCGAPYDRTRRRRLGKRSALVGGVILLLMLGAGTGLVLKDRHDQQLKEDRATALAEEQAEAEQAELDAQAEADETEREYRREQIVELEKLIKKDARTNVRQGILDGPILSASCTATGGGSTDDLTARTGTFDCIAVTKKHKDGTESGYGYQGTLDWDTGTATWQLDG